MFSAVVHVFSCPKPANKGCWYFMGIWYFLQVLSAILINGIQELDKNKKTSENTVSPPKLIRMTLYGRWGSGSGVGGYVWCVNYYFVSIFICCSFFFSLFNWANTYFSLAEMYNVYLLYFYFENLYCQLNKDLITKK